MDGRSVSRWLLLAAVLGVAGVLIAVGAFLGGGGPAGSVASAEEMRTVGKISPEDAKSPEKRMEALSANVTQGSLRMIADDGAIVECPLKHTDVKADISGLVARVKVTQTFYNPLKEKIEAVYVFPLPHSSAVDDMTLVLRDRRIVGVIKRRAEARSIYEQALAQGATAALLEQERPNIFTQSVGNIPPGDEVNVEISYVDVLAYDMGVYEFHFPMVVGPRYIPGSPTSTIPPVPDELKGKVGELDKTKVPEGPDKPKGDGWAPDTDRVPDASRITPPVLKPGFRTGHDISLSVAMDAGVPVQDLAVTNHKVAIDKTGPSTATVKLSDADTLPNKDFVLRYKVTGERPAMAVLTHTSGGLGYFLLMIQPKEDEKLKESPPREIVFLVDVSGSMSGQPTEKVKETMAGLLKLCKKDDTFQVVTFAGQATKLFPAAVPVTQENVETALGFTRGLRGGGGTEMLKGIQAAIGDPIDPKRMRVVVMLSDGFIGNEAEIIAEVGRRCGDQIRFWCIGIGSSVNRFLVDGVAKQGGGMGKVLGLNEDPTELVQEVMMRIHRAQLAKIALDWGGMQVFETYPAKIPELWAERPVILFGLYKGGGGVTVIVRGNVEGEAVSWPLTVNFPVTQPDHAVLEKVWARNKIEDLMQQTFYAGSPEVEDAVTSIALEYRLMSQYTSFVAVDESQIGKMTEPARPPRRMLVPVPIPEGTRYEGFFGDADGDGILADAEFKGTLGGLAAGDYTTSYGNAPMTMAKAEPRSLSPTPAREQERLGRRSPDRYRGLKKDAGTHGGGGKLKMYNGQAAMPVEQSRRGYRRDGAAYAGVMLDESRSMEGDSLGYAWQAFDGQDKELSERLTAALKRAEDLRAKKQLVGARVALAYAALLESAIANRGAAMPEMKIDPISEIESINAELQKAWAKDLPALDKRLDLVLRDRSVEEALADVAKASGLTINLLDGSIADAEEIVGAGAARITYLDLRRATVAQALEWMLRPLGMEWRVDGGHIDAGTLRRSAGVTPWVYDVSAIALPEQKEFEKENDYQKNQAFVTKSMTNFLKALRGQVGADAQVDWYAPGQALIHANGEAHAKARKLFAQLADPNAEIPEALAELHKRTSVRAEAHRDELAKFAEARAKFRVLVALNEWSWPLLSQAAEGKLDLEALTQLQIAWNDPATAAIAKESKTILPMRSLWAIHEAARALPDEAELQALLRVARVATMDASKSAAEALKKSPQDVRCYLNALYATLAGGDDATKALLTAKTGENDPTAPWRAAAVVLMTSKDEIDAKALIDSVQRGVGGDDAVVLTALACRRAGGEAWTTFRSESQRLLGEQPLAGSVVVLVNRLSRATLPVLATR